MYTVDWMEKKGTQIFPIFVPVSINCVFTSPSFTLYKASEPMICSLWLTYIRDMNFTEDLFI